MISAVCRTVRESRLDESYNDAGTLFHVVGPATDKARSPNFVLVCNKLAALAVEDRAQSISAGIGGGKGR